MESHSGPFKKRNLREDQELQEAFLPVYGTSRHREAGWNFVYLRLQGTSTGSEKLVPDDQIWLDEAPICLG